MSWLAPRVLAGVFAMFTGALIGVLVGHLVDAPLVGELLGGATAVAVFAGFDTMRGARLMEWLRGTQEAQAPRDSGFWGELGYRVERSIRERELNLAQEQMRLTQFLSAIEASPNGVLLLDAADQIEWCNSVAALHFGLDPQRDRRQHVTNLVRAPAFVACLQGEGGGQGVTYPNPRGPGTISVLIRRYGDGMKLVISQDITEREQAETMRRDFVANVSHEIRTPLTVLGGFIETMARLKLSEIESRRVLQLMAQQAARMQELVSDLLTLAKLEGSPRPGTDKWVPLAPLLARVLAEANLLSAGRHAITCIGDAAWQVAGDDAEMLSAMTNLVNNAIRYTPAGGQIAMSWRLLADGIGELAVSDTGPGIGREHLSRLTERFYRVDGSRARDTGGTGLGLSIVKHVIQRHGGELVIHSEVGQGSRFCLQFPAFRVRAVPSAAGHGIPDGIDGPLAAA